MARVKSIEEQLAEMLRPENLSKSGKINGKSVDQILVSEAARLKEILAKHIRAYYDSYSPKVYIRHEKYGMVKHLLMDVVPKNGSIAIYFDENHVWGPSVIDEEKYGWGFEPILIDNGWRVKSSAPHANIHRFGYYEGYHFIEKAIREFERTNTYGLKVGVQVDPNALKGSSAYKDFAYKENSDGTWRRTFNMSKSSKDVYSSMGVW